MRQVDSSLLDEWEQLTAGGSAGAITSVEIAPPASLTGNVRAFTVMVRNAMFRRVELAALRRYGQLGELDSAAGFDGPTWAEAMEPYFDEYDRVGTGPDARNPALLHVTRGATEWTVRQVFDDPEGDRDWGITATVDLAASDEAGEPVVAMTDVGPLSV